MPEARREMESSEARQQHKKTMVENEPGGDEMVWRLIEEGYIYEEKEMMAEDERKEKWTLHSHKWRSQPGQA